MEMSPLVAELERLYGEVVRRWLPDDAEWMFSDQPMLTIASRGRKATVNSWYNPAVWKDTEEDVLSFLAGDADNDRAALKRAEIVVASEILHDPVQVAAEVARQALAHRFKFLRPKVGSFYYNRSWLAYAAYVGCKAEYNPDQLSKGVSLWTPRQEFRDWANAVINFDVFTVSRDSEKAERKGSRMKKWQCGCTIIRSATNVAARCARCGNVFEWAETKEQARFLAAHIPQFERKV